MKDNMAELADAAQSELGKVELGEGALQGKPSALSLASPSLDEGEGYISHRPSEQDLELQRHGGCPELSQLAAVMAAAAASAGVSRRCRR